MSCMHYNADVTTTYPDHEHPQYVTRADLEAFEGRIINRLAEAEKRLGERMVGHRDLLVTALAIIGVNLTVVGISAAALFFAVNNLAQVVSALRPAS